MVEETGCPRRAPRDQARGVDEGDRRPAVVRAPRPVEVMGERKQPRIAADCRAESRDRLVVVAEVIDEMRCDRLARQQRTLVNHGVRANGDCKGYGEKL